MPIARAIFDASFASAAPARTSTTFVSRAMTSSPDGAHGDGGCAKKIDALTAYLEHRIHSALRSGGDDEADAWSERDSHGKSGRSRRARRARAAGGGGGGLVSDAAARALAHGAATEIVQLALREEEEVRAELLLSANGRRNPSRTMGDDWTSFHFPLCSFSFKTSTPRITMSGSVRRSTLVTFPTNLDLNPSLLLVCT